MKKQGFVPVAWDIKEKQDVHREDHRDLQGAGGRSEEVGRDRPGEERGSRMKSQRVGDMASGIFLASPGPGSRTSGFQIRGAPDVRMQPRTLPTDPRCAVGVAGVALALRAWRYPRSGANGSVARPEPEPCAS